MVTLLYRTLPSTLGYDTIVRRTCMVIAAVALQICGQTAAEIWLLFTIFSNLSLPNHAENLCLSDVCNVAAMKVQTSVSYFLRLICY